MAGTTREAGIMDEFSNRDRNVFVIRLPRVIDRGALMSRYSRTASLDIRTVYDREFAGNMARGADFYKRVFLDYGDESVAELVTAQVGVQNVTNVAAKVMEEVRIGISFLEKSSRYVRYDKKAADRYLFADYESIGIPRGLASDYEDHCNRLFETYSRFLPLLLKEVCAKNPVGEQRFLSKGKEIGYDALESGEREVAEKAYETAVRARVLDDVRYLLPASTLTNVGMSGNGRSFVNLIQKLERSGLMECKRISGDIFKELDAEMPELIKSAKNQHGQDLQEYLTSRDAISFEPSENAGFPEIKLVQYEPERNAVAKVVSLIDFPNRGNSIDIPETAASPDYSVIERISEMRRNRRHKLGRAFETVHYLFELAPTYASFREIQRHRMLTMIRKPLTASFGYHVPDLFAANHDLADEYRRLMDESVRTWKEFNRKSGILAAQYVVPFAFRYPIAFYTSLSEAVYFTELRSTPSAHYELREVSWQLADEISRVHPAFKKLFKFVDRSENNLGRIRSEARKEKKLKELGTRGNPQA